MNDDIVDDFWIASELDAVTLQCFVDRMNSHAPPGGPEPWARPGRPHPFPPVGRHGRVSTRRFGSDPIREIQLARVFAALAADGHGRRPHAAAGALYATSAVGFLLNCRHPLNGRIVQHHPVQHALYDIGPSPQWEELTDLVGGIDADGAPGLALCLFTDDAKVAAKYGVRGTRFALLETGAVLHQVGLNLAEADLVGYAVGGSLDRALHQLVKMPAGQRYVATMLIGTPRTPAAWWKRRRHR